MSHFIPTVPYCWISLDYHWILILLVVIREIPGLQVNGDDLVAYTSCSAEQTDLLRDLETVHSHFIPLSVTLIRK